MRVIGTSGHVDHGKSTLVKKLSGIDPDRLAEEQQRKMTIDLGFAWMSLPNGETVGIVDVPGHRDFIENMLAGVGGIDAALLVVAADEGIMPQTREHLAILRILNVTNIIVVVSKIDLIDDPDWLELVQLDIEELLEEHQLRSCPIVVVSAETGAGISTLVGSIEAALRDAPRRTDLRRPRLPIDRVFVIDGFGTVVTGTLSDGSLLVGDTVELQPSGRRGRVRGLQSYQRTVQSAEPGSRVAVNISAISNEHVRRGDMLAYPGQFQPTLLLDVHFHLLADAGRPLAHNAQVKFFSGASEAVANVRLLDCELLRPGNDGWLQIRLRQALPVARGDRFVLRFPSPAQTIGGGIIVSSQPGRRHRRFQDEIIRQLETLLSGSPAERLAFVRAKRRTSARRRLAGRAWLQPRSFQICACRSIGGGRHPAIGGRTVLGSGVLAAIGGQSDQRSDRISPRKSAATWHSPASVAQPAKGQTGAYRLAHVGLRFTL